MKNRKTGKKAEVQYVPGAAGDGLGFFPAVTCQIAGIAGKGAPRVLWIVHQRSQQLPTKEAALDAADAEIALGFNDASLPASPERFRDHLRQRGFSKVGDYRLAKSFDEDRRSVLGDAYQPAFGEAAARHDPVLHAALMAMVNRQLAEGDPPETREAFERLQTAGYSPEHARRLIGLLLAAELTREMLSGKPFDKKSFAESLRRLPEIPLP
jgi:hypothetical protein